MRVSIVGEKEIINFNLPNKINGNYWIYHYNAVNNRQEELINIESENEQWKLNSNSEVQILENNMPVDSKYLEEYHSYILKCTNNQRVLILFTMPISEKNLQQYTIQDHRFTVGKLSSNTISINNSYVADNFAVFEKQENDWYVYPVDANNFIYVNNNALKKKKLENGDTVFIMGFKLVFMTDFVVVNNPNSSVTIHSPSLILKETVDAANIDYEQFMAEREDFLYKEEEYFEHTPRLQTGIEMVEMQIDPPPAKQEEPTIPLLFTIAPMLTMASMSFMTGFTSIYGLATGTRTFISALPSLISCFAMLFGSLLIPMLSKRWSKKQRAKREQLRQTKYQQYLREKEEKIQSTIKIQKQILMETYLPLEDCARIILNKQRKLWERDIKQDDFMTIRLGVGEVPLQMHIKAPEEHFSLDSDELQETLMGIVSRSHIIDNVPIPVQLAGKNVFSILGDDVTKMEFLKGLILQLVTFQSYGDLKLVFMIDENRFQELDFVKFLPHTFTNDKTLRFYATNQEEAKQVASYLEAIYNGRVEKIQESQSGGNINYKNFPTYYLIITNDYRSIKHFGIIEKIASQGVNIGFSLAIVAKALSELPNECVNFMEIHPKSSGYFENILTSDKQKVFRTEINPMIDMLQISKVLLNIPIASEKVNGKLPTSLSFLEMYNIGMIEQLNVLNRWRVSSPMMSLQVPVGVHPNGDLFVLDLHEKAHGPHGLIAGSTGSGKSEFIITYILSMAVNYHPDEVQFVLIDYKGGGLAGAFENRETGLKIPHLIGTITNLDTVEMNRSLASIESELRRRQKIFNQARDALNESTIDIYKYQRFYREGLIQDPVSHLFIISDEFAELKSQQPEFMQELISIARIGRSLGVHLILATQKPTGVVNDQIWSNSKFKVCLKVSEKSDSTEMLKRPDAASLKEAGRFYLQVGYDELFALGQSAWCGAKYIPSSKIKKQVDTSLLFVNNIGEVYKTIDNYKKTEVLEEKGEQLPNIVRYLADLASQENIQVKPLWLPRIPDFITVEGLIEKYNYQASPYFINPVIGEYDDPNNQKQDLLMLSLTGDGNTVIYGSAGSGKENLLSTILYSTTFCHSPNEVNFYIMDFGSETLKMFRKIPHVGNVMLLDDREMIENLFKMLKKEIDKRKDLFLEYNGDYQTYCKNSGSSVPSIVVMLNGYEVFQENYPILEDDMIQLTREGLKYGITFILTATASNSIRYKLKQNFPKDIVLQLNDEREYSNILGNIGKMVPSKCLGRGLIKFKYAYEMQSAFITEPDNMSEFVRVYAQKLQTKYPMKAQSIPVLPEKVTYEFLKNSVGDLTNVPVGVYKESLDIATFNFQGTSSVLVTSLDLENIQNFASGITYLFDRMSGVELVILDAIQLLKPYYLQNSTYYNNNFDEVIRHLNQDLTNRLQNQDNLVMASSSKVVCVIAGMSSLVSKLSPESQGIFGAFLHNTTLSKDYNLVQMDLADKFKKMEYDTWYKETIQPNEAIWLGNGIADQFVVKLSKTPRTLRDEIPLHFGFVVKRGVAVLTKFIELETDEEGNVLEDDIPML